MNGPNFPRTRRPTRWERFMFWLNRRWPDSYVEARIRNADECNRVAEEWFRERYEKQS